MSKICLNLTPFTNGWTMFAVMTSKLMQMTGGDRFNKKINGDP
jgi:hypothetical protein